MSIRDNNSDIASKFLQIHNETERNSVLHEAREISKYIDPYFYVPDGHNASSALPHPLNSSTHLAANNFISKFTQTMFPFGQNFFKLSLSTYAFLRLKQQLQEQGIDSEQTISEISNELRRLERNRIKKLERLGYRKANHIVTKHLFYAGNCMVRYDNDSEIIVYGLDRFAQERDDSGFVLRAVLKERHSAANLSDEAMEVFQEKVMLGQEKEIEKLYEMGFVDIYTSIRWNNEINKYEVWQELETGDKISTTEKYTDKNLPWIFPCVNLVYGANYGRPIANMIMGHIKSAESFRYDINAIGKLNSRVFYNLDPSSTMRPRDVQKAKSGQVLPLKDGQLGVVQKQAYNELQQAAEQLNKLNTEIGGALLSLNTSIPDRERVTAEEIRARQEELMRAIGIVSTEYETTYTNPLAEKSYEYMKQDNEVSKVISDNLEADVVTGQSAFTRDDDLTKFRAMIADIANLGMLEQELNKEEIIRRFVELYNVENTSLVKTRQDKAEEEQLRQQQEQRAMIQQMLASGNVPQQQQPQ